MLLFFHQLLGGLSWGRQQAGFIHAANLNTETTYSVVYATVHTVIRAWNREGNRAELCPRRGGLVWYHCCQLQLAENLCPSTVENFSRLRCQHLIPLYRFVGSCCFNWHPSETDQKHCLDTYVDWDAQHKKCSMIRLSYVWFTVNESRIVSWMSGGECLLFQCIVSRKNRMCSNKQECIRDDGQLVVSDTYKVLWEVQLENSVSANSWKILIKTNIPGWFIFWFGVDGSAQSCCLAIKLLINV